MYENLIRSIQSILGLAPIDSVLSFPVFSQIVPDNTLSNSSIVESESGVHHITGGTAAGENLFHSFERFNILTGETAHFKNTERFDRVFARVTGRDISTIDGLLELEGTADLFFIDGLECGGQRRRSDFDPAIVA
ncbi:filamentous hemagglutinin N-terminal domain-containing protein [Geitlerinema sp. CS-897]|nr:filamentous hemagglutinin N-terminal domain-containing protein [Geitlerinema sp. CS-897]